MSSTPFQTLENSLAQRSILCQWLLKIADPAILLRRSPLHKSGADLLEVSHLHVLISRKRGLHLTREKQSPRTGSVLRLMPILDRMKRGTVALGPSQPNQIGHRLLLK